MEALSGSFSIEVYSESGFEKSRRRGVYEKEREREMRRMNTVQIVNKYMVNESSAAW